MQHYFLNFVNLMANSILNMVVNEFNEGVIVTLQKINQDNRGGRNKNRQSKGAGVEGKVAWCPSSTG